MTASQSSAVDATPRRRVTEAAGPVGSSARSRYRTNISGDGRLSLRNFVFRKEAKASLPREAFKGRLLTDASAYDAVLSATKY
jgi:hypothetical protein